MIKKSALLNIDKKKHIDNTAILLEHLPGANKGSEVTSRIINALSNRMTVTVIDSGYAYERITKLTGGTFVTMSNSIAGHNKVEHGKEPLTVFELSKCFEQLDAKPIREKLSYSQPSLLVIDEIWRVKKILPEWHQLLCDHAEAGGSYILCHNPNDLDQYPNLKKMTKNFSFISLDRLAAKHTNDQSTIYNESKYG